MVYKYCPKCNRTKIGQHEKMCDECTKKYGSLEKERYRRYQANRTDKEYQLFYTSKEWINKREDIKQRDNGLCLVCWFKNKLFVSCDCVHHIEELKENWNKRLEDDNLICHCKSCHKEVHRIYEKSDKDKIKMQNELKDLIERSKLEFGNSWVIYGK